MALDFNTEPFFDDFSEDNKFHRILFRPGYAVQARELTQLQTILQEQVRRHGDHIFKEGAMVIPGQISYDLRLSYVQLVTDININMETVLSTLVGMEIKNSSGLVAKVIAYTLAETVNGVLQPNTIFVKYQNSTQDISGNNVTTFDVGDTLTPVDGTIGLDTIVSEPFNGAIPPVGFGCSATIQRGIYYIKKNFVLVQDQVIVLDKYSNTPSYRVGLKLTESIVYPEDDENLLDNALGSPNYAAPGAARYKMDLTLTKITVDLDAITTTEEIDFIDLLRLESGNVIFKIDRTNYAEIEKTLARRTYDESGDYALNPFSIQSKDYRNNVRGDWAASEKFIQGDLINIATSATGKSYFVAVTSGLSGSTRPTFSDFASVDNFIDNQVTWEYVQYPNFNQGVHTFVAGDSSFTNFTLNDHLRLDGMIALAVEAGKAYVRGYEIEKVSTEYVPTQKSRYLPAGSTALASYFGVDALPEVVDSISTQKTASIDVSMGSYILVNTIAYVPNLVTLPDYKLYSVVKADAADATLIGYAKIRAIENHDVVDGVTRYKLFLFDIRMNSGKDFSAVKSIMSVTNPATSFSCNTAEAVGTSTTIQHPQINSLIFSLPDYAISNISQVTYSVVAPLTATASSGIVTFSAPTGYTFESINNANNYILVNNATGMVVTSPAYSIVAGSLRVTGVADQSHTVLATVKRGDVAGATAQSLRTVTDAPPMYLTTPAAAQVGTITLNHSYVTRIVSVLMSTHVDSGSGNTVWNSAPVYSTNITNRYVFHSGHDNNKIGSSYITLAPGMEVPAGPIIIKYEYLVSVDHSPGDFIGVNSYTHSASKMRYDQITTVSSYPLRDSVDFRPYIVDSGFQPHYFPKYGTTATFNYTSFLSRLDNISLSADGNYVLSRGIPSEAPSEPNTPNNCMRLAQVSVEPYTFTRADQLGVVINRQENKRYTMRDIGKLERRIQDLEYYTALSLTELDTKNMRIVDSQGLDRYQNGFLVDSFDGQGVGNAASDDWNASIDTQKKELRPFFSQKQVSLLENVSATARNYKVSGDLVTLPFTEVPMIAQTKASLAENVNPYALYSWKGIVDINPWSDTWFSTHHRPDIILNDESQYNAIVAKANADGVLGTVWNAWQVTFSSTKALSSRKENLGKWSKANTEILNASNNGGSFWRNRATFTDEELDFIGNTNRNIGSKQATSVAGSRVITIETAAIETVSVRTGTRSFVVDKVDSRVLEDRVVETQVVPYIRPRAVLFTGYGFKPSTNLYAFFDDIMVNDYVTPATRLKVSKVAKSDNINFYPYQFDVTRNAGSAVSNVERTVWYNDGVELSGTIALTNGSTTVTGTATAFIQQVQVGDFLNVGLTTTYKVASITDNYTLVLASTYTGNSDSGVSAKIIGPRHTTAEVEVAFNHGEVIREVNGNGNTAIVVGQEVSGVDYYIYVLNIKGTGNFSTATNAYLEGEYTTSGEKPRVKFLTRQDFSTLTTSYTGLLCGIFRIPSSPALKFRTGTRELKFSDSALGTNALRSTQESTSGGAHYVAQGLVEIKQRTIVATRTANIVSEQVSDTNTLVTTTDRLTRDTGWFDPLAQTFLVQQEGGAFITSVDLFFQTIDVKIPVRIEIREVVNGYPGSAVLPFSRVEKKGSLVATSENASVSTNFKFQSPVFLQNGVEYALVVLSDSNNYRLWISQTDTIDVLTSNRITSQPYNGVLFKSQNASTWTADQTQDMKFTINRADFAQTPVSVELIPPKLSFANLGFNPFNFRKGEKKCRIVHPNHGMVAGEYVILKTRQIIDSINGIPASEIFDTPLQLLSAELDSYVVQFVTTSIAEGQVGGGYICASENFEFSTAMIEIAEVVPAGTSIDYQAKVINHNDEISTYKMIPKENITFEDVKVYPSEANYTSSTFPSGLSIIATLNPSSTLKSISPVIDLSRLAMTMVSNKVDYPTIAVNDVDLDLFPITNVDPVTGDDIGTEIGTDKPINLIDTTGDGINDTIVVNSLTTPASILYNNLNNNLRVGDVLQFTYTGITDAVRNMTIIEKVLDTNGKLYMKLEGVIGETIMDTTSGQTVVIKWLSHFKSEYAAIGGSTHSKYVTKKINFSRPSEMLKIMLSAIIPTEAEVEIYYKTGLSISGDFISSGYKRAVPSSYTKSTTDFAEVVADVEGLDPFDSVMIKLVMKSINKSQVPRIKDFRVIACAA